MSKLVQLMCILLMCSTPLRAQQPLKVAEINAVMSHRAYLIGDTTRFDACSVFRALGSPATFPAGVDSVLTLLLDRTVEPCAGGDSTRVAVRWPPRFVRVDSISTGRAVLTVRKGDYSYREAYVLRAQKYGDRVSATVQEVRTYGFLHARLVPPGRRLQIAP
ncbi:MAG TPA: hypothetical protein VFJ16_12160 [Longimicrobium sp.]|nr:hypothetical protein [Longimicrobium sp.]